METIGLIISCIISLVLILYLVTRNKKTQLQKIFIVNVFMTLGVSSLSLAQKHLCGKFDINPIIFEWFIYIFTSFYIITSSLSSL